MTHKNISASVASAMGIDQSLSKQMEKAMVGTLLDYCCNLEAVAIPGFGTFMPIKSDERIVRDAEGKTFLLPPSIELKWRPSVMLRKHFVS